MKLSVVVPALNEAETLAPTLESAPAGAEIIVSDGESSDGTAGVAERVGAEVVRGAAGRARQMNRGAAAASGDVLLFLHADCVLDPGALAAMEAALSDARVVGGSFRLRIPDGGPLLTLVAFGSNLRARWLGTPYGDQGLFVRKEAFDRAGGFPDEPIMEDIALVRKLRREGRLVALDVPIVTGRRHWQRLGVVGTVIVDWAAALLYWLGVAPERIEPLYRKWVNGRSTSALMKATR